MGDTNQKELYKELPYRHDTQQEGDHNPGQKERTQRGIITEN